jgi:[protein-PII] uridylyltransferase
VGGYGRGELFPYSDVDVLVLLPAEPDATLQPAVEAFVTACWDIGLEVGSSVRTVPSAGRVGTRRDGADRAAGVAPRLWRTQAVPAASHVALEAVMDPRAFLRAKQLELQQRHVKYESTPYALEPNCKESPGGLRDLQVLIWVARAAGLGRTWRELAANGLLTPFEVSQLVKHEAALKLIRARLHIVAGRREDRLVFDLQTAVAESFGYKPTPANGQRSSEVLMHRYYWAAKAVTQLNQILLLNIEERINGSEAAPMRPLNERFLDRAGMLEVARDDLYLEQPARHPGDLPGVRADAGMQGLSVRTLRALYNARQVMRVEFRHDPVNRALFMEILRQPQGSHARLAPDEPDQRAGPLPVGLPAHRGAHAARPVPRLHGGPAHPDGGAQHAPLLHPGARARIPVLQPAGRPVGQALGAVRGVDLPRRRQGPRRRPFRTRRDRGPAFLPPMAWKAKTPS